MLGPLQSQCPLCGKSCERYEADYSQWHHFHCPCCREIKINRSFVDAITAAPSETKAELASQALGVAEHQVLTIERDRGNPAGWTWAITVTDRLKGPR